jgi:hypothetical protein
MCQAHLFLPISNIFIKISLTIIACSSKFSLKRTLHHLVSEGRELMSTNIYRSVEEAIHKLELHGFEECTALASKQNETSYLCAFKRQDDEQQILYCCVTAEDLFTLLYFVETFA